jgi:hypothetical protein
MVIKLVDRRYILAFKQRNNDRQFPSPRHTPISTDPV